MYEELAEWWPLLSQPTEYADEAARHRDLLTHACVGECRRVLELGSGGGNNASHLKHAFEMTLVDRSAAMLAVSRRLNPECEHLEGDMRTIRLDRTFDGVFAHDAVTYLTTEADLRATFETASVHLRPGGAAVFVPDHVRETLRPQTRHGGHDGRGRALRYLEWTWDPDPDDTTYVTEFAFLLREGDEVRVDHDRHLCGVFPRARWLELLTEEGFEAEARPGFFETEPGWTAFVARRPGPMAS